MKIRGYLTIIGLSAIIFSCGNGAPKGDDATVQEKQQTTEAQGTQYTVDTNASHVHNGKCTMAMIKTWAINSFLKK